MISFEMDEPTYEPEVPVAVVSSKRNPNCPFCGWFMAKVSAGSWRCANDIDVYRSGSYYGREHR